MAFVSRLVSQLTGIAVPPNKGIVGENAFSHESGIHVHGVLSECSTYEPMRPEIVGKERSFVVGKHSGVHAIQNKLREYGLELNPEQMKEVVTRVKKWAESGKKLDDAELLAVAYDVMGQEAEPAIKLEEFTVKLGDCEDAKLLSLGKSVGSDIVTTSVDAMVEGLNRLWHRKLNASEGKEERRGDGGGCAPTAGSERARKA